jgi:hypothetical protein
MEKLMKHVELEPEPESKLQLVEGERTKVHENRIEKLLKRMDVVIDKVVNKHYKK